jgi:hypothetical protein
MRHVAYGKKKRKKKKKKKMNTTHSSRRAFFFIFAPLVVRASLILMLFHLIQQLTFPLVPHSSSESISSIRRLFCLSIFFFLFFSSSSFSFLLRQQRIERVKRICQFYYKCIIAFSERKEKKKND